MPAEGFQKGGSPSIALYTGKREGSRTEDTSIPLVNKINALLTKQRIFIKNLSKLPSCQTELYSHNYQIKNSLRELTELLSAEFGKILKKKNRTSTKIKEKKEPTSSH